MTTPTEREQIEARDEAWRSNFAAHLMHLGWDAPEADKMADEWHSRRLVARKRAAIREAKDAAP
jgi:hypothetical protein